MGARFCVERTILWATDLAGDLTGLRLASRLAVDHAATLVLLHVVPVPENPGEDLLQAWSDHPLDRARRALKRLRPSHPGVPYFYRVEVGEPATVVEQVARQEGAEMVVLAASSRALWRRTFSPSLVDRLIDALPCPVVTYHVEHEDDLPLEPSPARIPERDVIEVLEVLLETRVHALRTVLEHTEDASRRIAARPSIRQAVQSLARSGEGRGDVWQRGIRRRLDLELAEHEHALGAIGIELRVGTQPILQSGVHAAADAARDRFFARVEARGGATSVPLEAADASRFDRPVLLTAAHVDVPGTPGAVLCFTLDARRDFLRILAQPGPTPSTETYAFDAEGLMLSNSRFPDQLRRMGLLSEDPGAQTARRLRVCEPHPDASAARGPLTHMAAHAVQGDDGADHQGYLDYRGVPVVGAWRWLADYEFGVAAEMDRGG